MTIKTTKATIDHLQTITDFNNQLFLHDIPFDNLLFKEWPYSEDGKEYFTKAITNS